MSSGGRRPAAAGDGRLPGRWFASAVLGGIAILGSGALTPIAPSPPMPGTRGPADRIIVAVPPVYPGASSGLLILPETQSTPAGPAVAPGAFGPVPVGPGARRDPRLPGQGPAAAGIDVDRPVWRPARLEPAVGIDALGHLTSILEYTPGRFER
jgi:hypothetical protein